MASFIDLQTGLHRLQEHSDRRVDKKVMCMTLDNASYNYKMIDCFKTRLLSKGVIPMAGKKIQILCCAQILNLIVQYGLMLIDVDVGELRDVIIYLSFS